MDLEQLIGGNNLEHDDWSEQDQIFGPNGQLKVVGWSGRTVGQKYYILRCSICIEDTELFGEGYFKSTKAALNKGAVPCGCSYSPRWTVEQYRVLCSRKAEELGYTFLGFSGNWNGVSTKLRLLCSSHGEWNSSYIHVLINGGYGCPSCGREAAVKHQTKSDSSMITSFFASGVFHPDTKFWRSDRKTRQGSLSYWFMSCPRCLEIGEAYTGSLQKGSMPCGCSRQQQTECYVNLVRDGENVVAIKFGISNNSSQRSRTQNNRSTYTIEKYAIYTFPDVLSCKKAERDCLQELECKVVLKRDMPDGYTETTWVYNLDRIIEIYKENGGTLEQN